MRNPIGVRGEFFPEDVILSIFHLFLLFVNFYLPALHSYGNFSMQ